MRATAISVLAIMPAAEDHKVLKEMLPAPKWMLYRARTLSEAQARLQTKKRISLVLCEDDLSPGNWLHMLEFMTAMPAAPFLIVTSRLADERLWAEALNRGAYDVLAKPFDATEVEWTLTRAWTRWQSVKKADARPVEP